MNPAIDIKDRNSRGYYYYCYLLLLLLFRVTIILTTPRSIRSIHPFKPPFSASVFLLFFFSLSLSLSLPLSRLSVSLSLALPLCLSLAVSLGRPVHVFPKYPPAPLRSSEYVILLRLSAISTSTCLDDDWETSTTGPSIPSHPHPILSLPTTTN